MMEIITKRDILRYYRLSPNEFKEMLKTLDKKYVAVDDVLRILNDDSITCFEDLDDALKNELQIKVMNDDS